MPAITPRSTTFDSGNLTIPGPLPLSGNCQLTVFDDGTWTFRCHAHDAGFGNIHYVISAVLVARSGKAYTFQHQGDIQGTISNSIGSPRRNDDFTSPVTSGIMDSFDDVVGGTFTANIDGNDATFDGLGQALAAVLKAAGVAAASAAGSAVVALLLACG
jgi:hypothetical protein